MKNQSLIKIKVVPGKNAKKVRKFWNFTIGCRVPQHEQKSKFDQDQTSSSWEKCKKVKKILKLYNLSWIKQKSKFGCRTSSATAWTKSCHSINQMKTSSSWEKCKKSRNHLKPVTIGCRMPQHEQKSKFDQDKTSSSLQKSEKICETLQLAAECHSINKNQSLMKISSSSEKCKKVRKFWNFTRLQNATAWTKIKVWSRLVPEKNAKKWRKFGNLQIGCRVPQHKQKSKFDQDETSSSWEKCQKLRNLWNFAIGCRMPQHEQKSMFDEDQ